jgi:hypothetical protein
MIRSGRETASVVLVTAWLGVAVGGFAVWENYDAAPGDNPRAADSTGGPAGTGRWELVMFAHPRCPCTRASLDELGEVLASNPAVRVRVLFVRPAGAGDGWERGDSWSAAAGLPGAEVACDRDGAEARRVGATTSGHVELTDPAGRVVFRGGVTKARGRAGASAGRRAVLAHLRGDQTADREAPVFGCPLFAPNDTCLEGCGSCPR